jgi:hypothetical protein
VSTESPSMPISIFILVDEYLGPDSTRSSPQKRGSNSRTPAVYTQNPSMSVMASWC